MECSFRGGVRAYTVFVFALARRFVRPLRKAPNHSAFESRPWTGLHRDGDGAHAELAVPRPNYFRNNDFEYSDGDGLYRRRYSEGEASRSLWSHRCGVRHRFHVRTCHWWIGWRCQSSSRILDCSCSQPRKLALGLLLRSRIAIARTTKSLSTTPGESSWFTEATAFPSRTLATDNDPVSCLLFTQRF